MIKVYTPTEEDFIRDKNGLSPLALKYLRCKTSRDLLALPHNVRTIGEYLAAKEYLRTCDLSEIPKYATCLSLTASDIIEKRLKEG